MKNKIIVLLALTSVVLGGLCLVQSRQLQAAKLQTAAVQESLHVEAQAREAQTQKIKDLEKERSRLGQNVDQFTQLVNSLRASESAQASNVARLSKQGAAGVAASSDEGAAGKGFGGMLTKMMKDPAMKDFMRVQQKTMIQKMYGSLVKDLNLAPEQKDKFMDLLLDQHMAAVDQAGSLLNPGSSDHAGAAQALKDKEAELNTQLKALLGEDKFTQYEDYKKTIGERLVLDQLKQQLEDGQTPLKDAQAKSLLQVMKEEREKVPPALPTQGNQNPADMAKLLTDETLEKQFQWQSDLNRRVLERAGPILTPEQLKTYTEFQTQQLNAQKATMKMAREMFGGTQNPTPGK